MNWKFIFFFIVVCISQAFAKDEKSADYYNTLGVSPGATAEEIKAAYRRGAMKFHPDRNVGKDEKEVRAFEEKFKELQNAYETLSNPDKGSESARVDPAEKYASSMARDMGPSSPSGSESPLGKMATKVGQGAASAAENVTFEVQAVMLMASLASVEGMRQQLEISGIKKEKVSIDQLKVAADQAAKEVWDRPETLGGIVGSASTKIGAIPLEIWNGMLQNTTMRPIFKEFLTHSSANLVGFVGFEAGAELMKWAVNMLPSSEDRAAANKIGFSKIIGCMYSGGKGLSKEDWNVAQKVLGNMFEILKTSDLRERWWSFIERNRIATGNFMAGVTMMSAGGQLGARLGGGASTCNPNKLAKVYSWLVGTFFGVVGGVVGGLAAAYVIPKSMKDFSTLKFQDTRMELADRDYEDSFRKAVFAANGAAFDENSLVENAKGAYGLIVSGKKYLDKNFTKGLTDMTKHREHVLEVYFDRIYSLDTELLKISNKINLAKEMGNAEAEKKLQEEYNAHQEILRSSKQYISDKLGDQIKKLDRVSSRASDIKLAEALKNEANTVRELKKMTEKYVDNLEATSEWGSKRGAKKNDSLMTAKENQRLLEKMYLWGFKQKTFVETMQFND